MNNIWITWMIWITFIWITPHTHTRALSLSLTHTHIHTHIYTHTHTLTQPIGPPLHTRPRYPSQKSACNNSVYYMQWWMLYWVYLSNTKTCENFWLLRISSKAVPAICLEACVTNDTHCIYCLMHLECHFSVLQQHTFQKTRLFRISTFENLWDGNVFCLLISLLYRHCIHIKCWVASRFLRISFNSRHCHPWNSQKSEILKNQLLTQKSAL